MARLLHGGPYVHHVRGLKGNLHLNGGETPGAFSTKTVENAVKGDAWTSLRQAVKVDQDSVQDLRRSRHTHLRMLQFHYEQQSQGPDP